MQIKSIGIQETQHPLLHCDFFRKPMNRPWPRRPKRAVLWPS